MFSACPLVGTNVLFFCRCVRLPEKADQFKMFVDPFFSPLRILPLILEGFVLPFSFCSLRFASLTEPKSPPKTEQTSAKGIQSPSQPPNTIGISASGSGPIKPNEMGGKSYLLELFLCACVILWNRIFRGGLTEHNYGLFVRIEGKGIIMYSPAGSLLLLFFVFFFGDGSDGDHTVKGAR